MFNTPHVGQPVQYLYGQGQEPFAAIIIRVEDPGPTGSVSVTVFPPPLHSALRLSERTEIPHQDAHGPEPAYPCWREAK